MNSETLMDVATDFESLWYDLVQKIEDIRDKHEVDYKDKQFRELIEAWLGDDAYYAYIDWYEEGED